jgi:hypothetical protein
MSWIRNTAFIKWYFFYLCIVLYTLLFNILFTLIFRTELALSCGAPSGAPPPSTLLWTEHFSNWSVKRVLLNLKHEEKKTWSELSFCCQDEKERGMRANGYFSQDVANQREWREVPPLNGANVLCVLSSLPLPPSHHTMAVFGSCMSSLYS